MTERTMPTLTARGWLGNEDTAERLDRALSYAFTADHSQSVTFKNSIVSLQWLISKHGSDPLDLQSAVQSTMTTYLRQMFDRVDVEIRVTKDASTLNLEMTGKVTNAGKSAPIGRLLTVRDSTIVKVANTLNGDVEDVG